MIVVQKPSEMPGEQEHHICLHRFSFIYAVNDLWEDAYTCPINAMNCTTESANLRYGTHGYEMDAYEGMAKINLHSQSKLIITSVNQI